MNSKKRKDIDHLNNINYQFKELIDLIEKENDSNFSMKYFDSLKKSVNYSKRKWSIIGLVVLLSIFIYFILLNENLTYNIYFVLLSYMRSLLINVRNTEL